MKAHLITGYAGEEHIMSEDQGSFNAAFFGGGQYVMEAGCQFEGSIIDNNTVRILDGDLLMYGRHIRIKPDTYEDLTITTGTAGVNRVDLICMTYEMNTADGIEKAYLQVIKGTESEGTASAPEYTNGNILEGATFNQMPLYSVTIEGVVLKEITPIFETIPSYGALGEKYEAEFIEACRTHLDSLNILDTLEEVEANTQGNQLAGALAVKEVVERINDINDGLTAENGVQFQFATDGEGNYGYLGADDSFIPFSRAKYVYTYWYYFKEAGMNYMHNIKTNTVSQVNSCELFELTEITSGGTGTATITILQSGYFDIYITSTTGSSILISHKYLTAGSTYSVSWSDYGSRITASVVAY